MSEFVVITGLSGAGRSQAADDLEDLGWFVIDNLPAELIPKVAELVAAPGSRHAAGRPGRGRRRRTTTRLLPALAALRAAGARVRAACSSRPATDVLVRRYESTRRRHPLLDDGRGRWPRPSSASARCSSR